MKQLRFQGHMRWVLPTMLALVAITVLLSNRDLAQAYLELEGAAPLNESPLMPWIQRAGSIAMVLICVERIALHFRSGDPVPSPLLASTYALFWAGTVAAPALLGAHRLVSHDYAYSLVIGLAFLLTSWNEVDAILDAARTSLMLLMLAGVAMIPIAPAMVLDTTYNQGLFSGVPRLAGLAPHAVTLGLFAQTALLLLWSRPYRSRFLNVVCWLFALAVLFFAQSKTAWVAFVLCGFVLTVVRTGPSIWARMSDPREGAFGALICIGTMLMAGAMLILLLFVNIGDVMSGIFDTEQGAQLMTMTGRDRIWAIAFEEWQQHKIFGYGPGLWDDDFRRSIGMPNATHGHNQFMDALARSGTVGATVTVIYAIVLLVLSVRYARQTRGLSVALCLTVALRSVSEVPLLLFGYGSELFAHALLLLTIAAGASRTRDVRVVETRRPAWRVAT